MVRCYACGRDYPVRSPHLLVDPEDAVCEDCKPPSKEGIRVIIAGSRGFNNPELLYKKMDFFLSKRSLEEVTIISGGAAGADKIGEKYAIERGYALKVYPAEWGKYGKSAGYKRNQLMALKANFCVCFWDGVSRGTKHMIDIAQREGLRTVVVLG